MATGAAAAEPWPVERERVHHGIRLAAAPADPTKSFDASLLPGPVALGRIAAALDLLVAKSPASARALARLKASGRVVIVYRPDDLRNRHGGENVAVYLPDYFRHRDRPKRYLVVVGRHGVKWPIAELAATLAHELVGHGMQQLRGRLATVRHLDAECEANLYEEMANQDIGLDKRGRRMIAFRQAMERHWCADFKSYMRAHRPGEMRLWNELNPDMPKLLSAFEDYLSHAARSGMTASAVDALKRQTREDRYRGLAKASASALYREAIKLRDGDFGVAPDAAEALRYFKHAAEKGHAKARLHAARMDRRRDGGSKRGINGTGPIRFEAAPNLNATVGWSRAASSRRGPVAKRPPPAAGNPRISERSADRTLTRVRGVGQR